jgi:hypothetical protein
VAEELGCCPLSDTWRSDSYASSITRTVANVSERSFEPGVEPDAVRATLRALANGEQDARRDSVLDL